MTWPDLVLSIEQSGMILDSCTIQLLILSRRRRSTMGKAEDKLNLKTQDPDQATSRLPLYIITAPNLTTQLLASPP